jgi:BlaI family penicillinase repressor
MAESSKTRGPEIPAARKKRSAKVHLSELQLDVVRELWRRGEASTAEVAEALAASRGLAHTTVATLLARLEKRGVLSQRRDGRNLLYRALVSEDDVRRSMVSALVSSLFQGDPAALVAHLVSADEVAPGDVERARALLARTEPKRAQREAADD